MRGMLEKLYFGNINSNDKQFIHGTDYDKAVHALSQNEEKLFFDLVNAQGLVDGTTAVESFISGFRLGAELQLKS